MGATRSARGAVGTAALVVACCVLFNLGVAAAGAAGAAATQTRTSGGDGFPTYDGNLARTGLTAGTSITPGNASQLHQVMHVSTTASISAQPIVDDGRVYWSDWYGYMHATTLTGKALWSTPLGTIAKPPGCPYKLATQGVLSTPTFGTINGTRVLWVGGGRGQVVALNAVTGKILWQRSLRNAPGSSIWSSPAYYEGSIYVGVASWNDCPSSFGWVARLNAATGTLQAALKFSSLVPAKCKGPGAWSSPAVDAASNTILLTTSNDVCGSRYQDAIVELDPTTLHITSMWQVPSSQRVADSDFGASTTLFTAPVNGVSEQLAGAENKNGIYYALNRQDLSAGPVWSYRAETAKALSNDLCNNTISTSGWAGPGSPIVVAGVATSGSSCIGTLAALDPSTGQPEWQVNLPGGIEGAVTVAPGIIVVGAGRTVQVLSSANGSTLFSYTEPLPRTGDKGLFGAPRFWFWGPPTLVGQNLVAANQDGTLRVFSP